jgi:hypothetical protein
MAKEKSASLRPSDFSESTGLWEGIGVISEAEFVIWNYGGEGPNTPAAKFTIQPEDGEEVEQYFSCGKESDWIPSKDGSRLMAVGRATGINTSSNFALLLASMVNAGYPEDKMTDSIKDFIGLNANWMRVPAPKRPGLKQKEGQEQKERTILTVGDIIQLPWEKKPKAGSKAPAKAAKGKAAAKDEEEDEGGDLEEEASTLIMEVLVEQDGEVIKQQLPKFLFPKLKGNPNMKAILQLVQSDDFLGGEVPWSYEDGTITM